MQVNDRVAVSLPTLVNLARTAAGLKLYRSKIRAQQSGGYVSRYKGRGMEFDETRLYQPGDDIRSIDWRVTARTGKTHTKLYREERERPVFISVDYRASMQFATRGVFKAVQAAKLAALLAWTAQQHGDRIGGQVFTEKGCRELKPQNGKQGVLRFFNSLVHSAELQQETASLPRVLTRLTQHARPGSLVYIISDFRGLDQQAELFLAKLARHCDVVLILVFDWLERQLPTQGRYRFTDQNKDLVVDTGDRHKVMQYQEKFNQHYLHLERLGNKLNMKFMQCSTGQEPADSLR